MVLGNSALIDVFDRFLSDFCKFSISAAKSLFPNTTKAFSVPNMSVPPPFLPATPPGPPAEPQEGPAGRSPSPPLPPIPVTMKVQMERDVAEPTSSSTSSGDSNGEGV